MPIRPRQRISVRVISALTRRATSALTQGMSWLGIGAVGYGVWQIHGPTAWIVVGVIVVCVSELGAFVRRSAELRKESQCDRQRPG